MGGSLYVGDQGQGEEYGNEDIGFRKVGVFTQLYEIHTEVRTRGLWFRALGTTVLVDDAGVAQPDDFISARAPAAQPIGKVMLGAYAEVAYDLMPLVWPETTQYLAPWFRYSWLDTNNKVAERLQSRPRGAARLLRVRPAVQADPADRPEGRLPHPGRREGHAAGRDSARWRLRLLN